MRVKLLLSLIICMLTMYQLVNAQDYGKPGMTLGQITAEYDSYFDALPDKFEKGSGFKQYERWKYFWEQRISEDDTIPSMAWMFETRNDAIAETGLYSALGGPAISRKTTAAGAWQSLGADQSPGGYEGVGRLMSIGFHPIDKNIFYVGTPAGGLWKTTDFGSTWTPLTDYLPQIGISGIIVDHTNPNKIYIATGDPDGRDANSIGVLKSIDGGATWDTTGLTFDITHREQIYKMIGHPTNSNIMMVAATDGIYRTTDGATTWTKVQGGLITDLIYHPTNPNVVYAINRSGLSTFMRSVDGGQNWISTEVFNTSSRVNLAVSPTAPTLVRCFGVKGNRPMDALYESHNQGATFTRYADPQVTGLNLLAYDANGSNLTGGQGWYDLAFVMDPQDSNHITVGGINLWDSYDGGLTWQIQTFWYQSQGLNVVHADQHFTTYHPLDPTIQFALNDGGIYYRDLDSSHTDFFDISNGLCINQIYKLAIDPEGDDILTGLQDNGSKLRENGTWRRATGGDGGECAIDPRDNDIMYAEYVYGVVYRSYDKFDDDRETISDNLPSTATQGAWITPFELHSNSTNEILIGYSELYYSDDRGDNFVEISNFPAADVLRSVATTPASRDVCFATDYDRIRYTYDFFGNTPWTSITSNHTLGLPLANLNCNMVEISPIDPGRVIAVFSGFNPGEKVYQTTDSGNTWVNISDGLPNLPALCVAMDNSPHHGIYVGMDVGVYYKNDMLPEFIPFGDSLPHTSVTKIVFSDLTDQIFCSTYGRGVWSNGKADDGTGLYITSEGPTCDSVTNVFTAIVTTGPSMSFYWEVNSLPFATTSVPTLSTDALVKGDKLSCIMVNGTDSSRSNVIVYNPLANPTPNIYLNSLGTIIVSQNYTGNQWLRDGEPIPGAINKLLNIGSNYGTYSLVTTYANGCMSDTSNLINVWPEGVDDLDASTITLHPTVADDYIYFESEIPMEDAAYRVIDARGALVGSGILMGKKETIKVSNLASGFYIFEIPSIGRSFKFQKK